MSDSEGASVDEARTCRRTASRATSRRLAQALAAVGASLAVGSAVAAPIADPADPALGPAPIVVDFESATPATYPAYAGGLSVPTAEGPVNFTAARVQITSTYAGRYNTTGQYLSSEGYLFRNLIVTFPAPVRAFGMNVGLTSQPWELQAYDASGALVETVAIPALRGSNAGNFFGIASPTPIAQAILIVQLPIRPGPQWVVVDNVAFPSGQATPSEVADLAVELAQRPHAPRVGRRLGYRVTTVNHGPATAAGATLVVSLAGTAGSDLATIVAPRRCTVSGAIVTCPLGDLAAGRRRRISITVVPSAAGEVSAVAAASSAATDPTPGDAIAEVTTTVAP